MRQQALAIPAREPHPTAMIERPGRVLSWIFARFFKEIVFPPEVTARIRELSAGAQIVYVCRTLSYIDYLYFTFAFLGNGLPLARFANGVKTVFLAPLGRILRGLFLLWRDRRRPHIDEFTDVVKEGGATLLFLKRPQTVFTWEPAGFKGPYVERLIEIQRARGGGEKPIVFVPIVLLWGSPAVRAAKMRTGLVDTLFGGREAPGRLRALWLFFRHYADSQVVAGAPLELEKFLAEEAEQDQAVLARRIRWELTGRLESEVRVVLGPVRKGARRIRDEVLKGRKLNEEAREIAREENIPWPEVERRARKALGEIAADPSPWAFDLLKWILAWVWRRIFDGFEVDQAGLQRVREAAHKGPLILVPSHKSHIDYLVLSYVFSENDLVPPHIAAGANLSFFPLGFVFRRAGAFFLRRSFKGDRLYGAVFRAYVRKLLREGNGIEFFIEGGRSRTGKVLAPKLGLLSMLVEPALDPTLGAEGQRARRAQVVPISIGYEKVIEEKSYARELQGGEKKKESVAGLVRATRVLRGQYGRLNIQFDEPFPLEEMLPPPETGADESAKRQAVQRIAHRIVFGINRVTAVTPTALVAAGLLGSGRRGTSRRDLLAGARFLVERARAAGGRLSESLVDPKGGPFSIDALDRALALLSRDGHVEIRGGKGTLSGGVDEIYTVPDESRPRVAFYRNNAVHLFVAEAQVALALLSATRGPQDSRAERVIARGLLRERTYRISRLLKLEFAYRTGTTFAAIFEETLNGLSKTGLLKPIKLDDGGEAFVALRANELTLLAGQVSDFVEAYRVTALALAAAPSGLQRKELLRRVQELGEKMYLTGEVKRREACLDANYQNALDWLAAEGVKPAAAADEIGGYLA